MHVGKKIVYKNESRQNQSLHGEIKSVLRVSGKAVLAVVKWTHCLGNHYLSSTNNSQTLRLEDTPSLSLGKTPWLNKISEEI